ncbi:MAG: hypothetical protein AB7E70_20315 [Hyphomicrobiaceae bacterium]
MSRLYHELDNDTRDFKRPYLRSSGGLACPCGGDLERVGRRKDGGELNRCPDGHYWLRVDGEYEPAEAPK